MKYLIYSQLVFEIDAKDEKEAKEESSKKFKELEEKGFKVENARVADKGTGYFI